ncbi:MAG: cytochrome P450 [Maricaulaceae bacterium]|nr:cytochrome P450 [Maricaulaceae bacterium]
MRDNPLEVLPEAAFELTRVSVPSGGRHVHIISGPEEMRSVLQDRDGAWRKSPLILRMLRPVVGDSLFTAHGERWRFQRQAVNPGFAPALVALQAEGMAAAGEAAAQTMLAAGGTADVMAVMNDATLGVIERALFSRSGALDSAEVRRAIETLFDDLGRVRFTDLLPLPEWAPRAMSLRGRAARNRLRRAVEAEIDARRSAAAGAGGGEEAADLLSFLLAARYPDADRPLSRRDVRDNVLSLIIAGHETTAIALSWALYLAASAPDVQERLAEEAEQAFAAGAPAAETLRRLPFAKQVIEESLRLFPPGPILGRRATRATRIAEREVKAGDIAVVAIFALHRHKRFWEAPDSFDPDRFTPGRRPQDPWLFRPFSGGPRACVGGGFAMTEAPLMLARIVSRVRLSPVPDHVVQPMMTVTLRARGGLPLRAEPREKR